MVKLAGFVDEPAVPPELANAKAPSPPVVALAMLIEPAAACVL